MPTPQYSPKFALVGSHETMFDIEMFGMILVALGIVFGDDPLIGYGFIGVSGILAVVDIIKNLKKK